TVKPVWRWLRLAYLQTLVAHVGLQFTCLEHLADDIATTDKLTLHVELRNGRPVGVVLDSLAQLVRSEDVDALVVDAEIVENLRDLTGEAALRRAGNALHKEHDVVRL